MRDFRTPSTDKLNHIRELALDLLRKHDLADWNFRYDKARTRYGQCNHTDKIISLSEYLTLECAEETIRDTILHEIAHALTPGHHHDYAWRSVALSIGCSGKRTCDEVQTRGKYRLVCPNGHEYFMYRRTKTVKSCAKCNPKFDERYILEWED